MILFTILVIMLVILLTASVLVMSITGAVGVILFGDIIVCIWIIIWFIKKLRKKKHK